MKGYRNSRSKTMRLCVWSCVAITSAADVTGANHSTFATCRLARAPRKARRLVVRQAPQFLVQRFNDAYQAMADNIVVAFSKN